MMSGIWPRIAGGITKTKPQPPVDRSRDLAYCSRKRTGREDRGAPVPHPARVLLECPGAGGRISDSYRQTTALHQVEESIVPAIKGMRLCEIQRMFLKVAHYGKFPLLMFSMSPQK